MTGARGVVCLRGLVGGGRRRYAVEYRGRARQRRPPSLACGRVVRVSLLRLRSEGGIPPERSMKKPRGEAGFLRLVIGFPFVVVPVFSPDFPPGSGYFCLSLFDDFFEQCLEFFIVQPPSFDELGD